MRHLIGHLNDNSTSIILNEGPIALYYFLLIWVQHVGSCIMQRLHGAKILKD